MTILDRTLNNRLSNLERCAETAPEGTYEVGKAIADLISEASDAIAGLCREAGFTADNADGRRNLECAIYAFLLASNSGRHDPSGAFTGAVTAAEGFGSHVDGPAGPRIIQQAARDRDNLRALGVIPAAAAR